jgi:hypothetical protein
MKKLIIFLFVALVCKSVYSQFDDILKKIPGVGEVFEDAVTTSIKDAYGTAYWLQDVDKQMRMNENTGFSLNLPAGYYKYKFNTFCLHAGTYAPTEGAGYLVAPLKGAKANLIKDILGRYYEHPEIDQKDVQILIWGIEVGMKFSDYTPDFQLRVTPLLKPEELALMEVDVKDIAFDLLPQEAKDVLYFYSNIRGKLSDANSTYEEVERLTVKTGIAPKGKGSKNIDAGVWTSVGDGVYIRCFPYNYNKTDVEIYIPQKTTVEKDGEGRIKTVGYENYSIEFSYEGGAPDFKTAKLKNININDEITIDNTAADYSAINTETGNFINMLKKSFGSKKFGRINKNDLEAVKDLKNIQLTLKSIFESQGNLNTEGYSLAIDAVNGYISEIESKIKRKSGSKSSVSGLGSLNGLVFAPANTSNQRLGSGGPEGGNGNQGDPPNTGDPNQNDPDKDKKCNVKVYLSQVSESEIPKPDLIYTVRVDINIEGDDEKCLAEEIKFNFLDVSKEKGRFMNDADKYNDVEDDLIFSDLNQGFTVTGLTASKQLSGRSQSVEAYILCRDYGAFGRLGVTVKVKGKWYEAEADGSPDKYITIPLDINDNNIADGWEKQNNVYGKPGSWDEDPTPSGQKRNGDGMTNYEEYRGFMVSDGAEGKEHKRMNPLQKEVFIIDMDKIFDVASWKAASGITAYWLTTDLIYGSKGGGELNQTYRWVNFCRGNAQGSKYAVLLKKIVGIDDPYKLCGNGTEYSGCNKGDPVMNAELTIVLPDRLRKWLTDVKDSLSKWLIKYPNGFQVDGTNISKNTAKAFIDAVNNTAKFEEMINFHVNQNVIHEVGHALGIPHHGGGTIKSAGDKNCPMRYFDYVTPITLNSTKLKEALKLVESNGNVIVTYTSWKFCKNNDNCWRYINAKDE